MAAQTLSYAEQLAREIKETPTEYLPILLEIVRLFREGVTLKPAEASFRQGWKEMLAGETRPVSELWEGIDANWIKRTSPQSKFGYLLNILGQRCLE